MVSFEALDRNVGACRPTFSAQEGKATGSGNPGYGGRGNAGAAARFSFSQGNAKGDRFAGGENTYDS